MKPTIKIFRTYKNGEIQSVELFRYKKAIMLHRHLTTKDKEKAEMFGIVRKFWNTYYCKQQILLLDDEIVKLVELLNEIEKPNEK